MSGWRRYLLVRAIANLSKAEAGLHLVPQAAELHGQVREQLRDLEGVAPLVVVLHLWWCTHCIERCVHHARQAEVCR